MPLSWNEIKSRAMKFSKEWQDAHYEKGETQSFYNDFFEVFGISRRKVGFYEQSIKKLNNTTGFIDLFWPGTMLVEQKSAGRSLKDAKAQVFNDYLPGIDDSEFPRYILLSDFQNFELLDLETGESLSFILAALHENVQHFAFIAGYKTQVYRDQDPVNIEASELMSELHRQLEESGYKGHDLEMLLVRLMFCLFGDDTGIFEKDHFLFYLENHTKEDGSDLGGHLLTLFDVLNTPEDERQSTLDEDLTRFPYVNGALFERPLRPVSFDTGMRHALLQCCLFDWSKVSPALFGSLFQTVMLPEEQRKKGAHYTSEKNVLKVIHPLFLDELWQEFEKIKTNGRKLLEFHKKLSRIRILDPACGCGNFLILAYRELRVLELEILKRRYAGKAMLDVSLFSLIDVDQFYGIELEEFPARIAETAMWLIDHQMNIELSETFGQAFVRLPLEKSAQIVLGNALTMDWKEIIAPDKLSYIISNPPFLGKKEQTKEKKEEVKLVFKGVKGRGVMDYVSCWYLKAAEYMQGTDIRTAFVSTKSIVQGEQVGILWNEMYKRNCRIFFAHRTFKWTLDAKKAKGMKIAAVHVVIIGFAAIDVSPKHIFEYETVVSDPHMMTAKTINAYLVDGPEVTVTRRSNPLCNVTKISKGSEATDFGHLVLTPADKDNFFSKEPRSKKWIRHYVGGDEYINNVERYCLWLVDIDPTELKSMPLVMERVLKVKEARLKSDKKRTKEWAALPALFSENRQPKTSYLAVPKVSSERRNFIPIGFVDKEWIASGSLQTLANATPYEFGIMSSTMHMAWMRYVGGRTKSDYQYSNTLVYNNFPWPEPTGPQKKKIEEKAQAVLDARTKFPTSSLSDLYDPHTMPPALLKAHQELDKAVDTAYRKTQFKDERTRVEYLFDLYQKLSSPLTVEKKKQKQAG